MQESDIQLAGLQSTYFAPSGRHKTFLLLHSQQDRGSGSAVDNGLQSWASNCFLMTSILSSSLRSAPYVLATNVCLQTLHRADIGSPGTRGANCRVILCFPMEEQVSYSRGITKWPLKENLTAPYPKSIRSISCPRNCPPQQEDPKAANKFRRGGQYMTMWQCSAR